MTTSTGGTVYTVVGVTKLIYTVLERDYGIPNPTGGGGGGVTVTAGLNQAQVQAIVDTAIANLPAGGAGGVTQAQVDAAIAAAIATVAPSSGELQSLIDGLAGRPNAQVSTAVNKFNTALEVLSGLGPAVGNALAVLAGEAQPYPGEPAVDAAVLGWLAKIETSVAAWNAGGGLTPEQAALLAQVQPLLDLLAVKPGATVPDVEVVWQALSDGSVAGAQLLSALSGKPVSANPTAADVQAGLPVLIQAIVDESTKQLTTKTEHQSLINALCSAPFVGMTGNVTNNVAKVGVWVNIAKQEIENLEANLKFAYDKVVENKTAIAGVVDRVTVLEGAALSGEGVSQAVVDSLLARLDTLEAENVAMKAELAQKISETDIAALREQAAFAVDEAQRLEAQDAEIVAWVTEKYAEC
jgi:hypothetical protein